MLDILGRVIHVCAEQVCLSKSQPKSSIVAVWLYKECIYDLLENVLDVDKGAPLMWAHNKDDTMSKEFLCDKGDINSTLTQWSYRTSQLLSLVTLNVSLSLWSSRSTKSQ